MAIGRYMWGDENRRRQKLEAGRGIGVQNRAANWSWFDEGLCNISLTIFCRSVEGQPLGSNTYIQYFLTSNMQMSSDQAHCTFLIDPKRGESFTNESWLSSSNARHQWREILHCDCMILEPRLRFEMLKTDPTCRNDCLYWDLGCRATLIQNRGTAAADIISKIALLFHRAISLYTSSIKPLSSYFVESPCQTAICHQGKHHPVIHIKLALKDGKNSYHTQSVLISRNTSSCPMDSIPS